MNKNQNKTNTVSTNTSKSIAEFNKDFEFNKELLKELIIDFNNNNNEIDKKTENLQKYFFEFLICYEDLPFRYNTTTNEIIWDSSKEGKERIIEGFERFLENKLKFIHIKKINKSFKEENFEELLEFVKNKFINTLIYIQKDFTKTLKKEQKNNIENNSFEDNNIPSEDSMDIKKRFYKTYLSKEQYDKIESYFKYNKYIVNGLKFDSQIEAQVYFSFILPFENFKIPNREDLNIFTGSHVLYKKMTDFNNGNRLDFINKKLKFVLEISSYMENSGAYNDPNHGKKYYFNDEIKSIHIDIFNTLSEILKKEYNFDLFIFTNKGTENYDSVKTVTFNTFKDIIFERLENYINNSNFNKNDKKLLKDMQSKYIEYVETTLKNMPKFKKFNKKLDKNQEILEEKNKEKIEKQETNESMKDISIKKENIFEQINIPPNVYIKIKFIKAKINILKLELSNDKKSGVYNNKNGANEFKIKKDILLEFEEYLSSDLMTDKLIKQEEINHDMIKNEELIQKYMKELIKEIESEMNKIIEEYKIKYKNFINKEIISKYFDKIILNINLNHLFHLETNDKMSNLEKQKINEYNKLFNNLKIKMINELKNKIMDKIQIEDKNIQNNLEKNEEYGLK